MHTTIIVMHTNKDKTQCGNRRGIFLVDRAGKTFFKITSRSLSEYCEKEEVLPDEQRGFRPGHSTVDMVFVVHRQQGLGHR